MSRVCGCVYRMSVGCPIRLRLINGEWYSQLTYPTALSRLNTAMNKSVDNNSLHIMINWHPYYWYRWTSVKLPVTEKSIQWASDDCSFPCSGCQTLTKVFLCATTQPCLSSHRRICFCKMYPNETAMILILSTLIAQFSLSVPVANPGLRIHPRKQRIKIQCASITVVHSVHHVSNDICKLTQKNHAKRAGQIRWNPPNVCVPFLLISMLCLQPGLVSDSKNHTVSICLIH